VGFVHGFASGADTQRAWLTHCYGALGVGRGLESNSGNASSLYVVTGHAPRHLDRNVTLIGRVIHGMELLSSLPRGSDALGFYATPDQHIGIKSVRFGDQVPPGERLDIEILRTDSVTFTNYVQARTHRRHPWFIDPVGKIEICNVGVPSREKGE
jgi:peptidylprolyl isomerase